MISSRTTPCCMCVNAASSKKISYTASNRFPAGNCLWQNRRVPGGAEQRKLISAVHSDAADKKQKPGRTPTWNGCSARLLLYGRGEAKSFALITTKKPQVPYSTCGSFGRSDGIRTHGLLVPNQARYQLRYTPKKNPQQLFCCGGWG